MEHYIIQTIAFQVFFLLIYDVFLKKETFFNWNRFFLLTTAVLSVILPFIKIESFKEVVPQQYIVRLPEIILGQTESNINTSMPLNPVVIDNAKSLPTLEFIFYLGTALTTLFFLFKLSKVLVLILRNQKTYNGKLTLVKLINSNAAFSFFRYVFLGELLSNNEKTAILKHELIHVKQNHTLDLLFFEILRILFWYNPLVYMYQNRITSLHEFIADAEAVKHENKSNYYQNLLAQVFETKKISFINPFFKQSLIKKRIVMLQKSKSKQIHLLKYTLLIPMVFGMLVYTSCSTIQEFDTPTEYSINTELTDEELKTKLSEEYYRLKDSGADFNLMFETFSMNTKNYILTREEYYRQKIFFTRLLEKSQDMKYDEFLNRNYNEYLEFKKTDKAKESWENATNDGVLKLVVNDFKNLTAIEEEKKTKKMKLLLNDDFFTKFIMTDGKAVVTAATTESSNMESNVTDLIAKERLEVPFAVIDQVPVFPGCESLTTNDAKKECISKSISKHVNRNFNTKLANELGLKGRQRINVIFKIDTAGNIIDVRSRAPHPGLEEEAIRVINTLPQMIPGEQNGEKVTVPYSLPIIFQVAENKAND
jgi:hypothetical protein